MSAARVPESDRLRQLVRQIAEAELHELTGGGVDAILDPDYATPILLRRTQQALQESEARYRRLVASMPAVVIEADPNGDVTFVNDALTALTGYRPEDFLGKRWVETVSGAGRGTAVESWLRHGATRELVGEELSLPTADGAAVTLLVSTVNQYAADGTLERVVAIGVDVSRRKAAEQALQRTHAELEQRVQERTADLQAALERLQHNQEALATERERLAVTLRSIGDAVIATDAGGRVVLMNRAAETLIGRREDEARGLPVDEVLVIHDEETGEALTDVAAQVRANVPAAIPAGGSLVRPDGSARLVTRSAAPILDAEGRLAGIVVTVQDATEQRLLEQELLRANKIESLGVLAGGIAHDFNNLLTGILGNIILARMEAEPGSAQEEALLDAERASTRATGLTHQLLTFARGGDPLTRPLALEPLLQEAGGLVSRDAAFRCRLQVAAGLWPVQADRLQLVQVMRHLLANAQEAMPRGGTIEVRAENVDIDPDDTLPLPPGRYVRVTVIDEGTGIRPEHLNRVFDPYFSTKGLGSGLGLAVCYSVVNKHGGYITVRSRPGEGACFTFHLPAAGQPLLEVEPGSSGNGGEKGRVLVMDDEEVVRRVAKRMIEKLGYEVELAADGPEAIEMYRREAEAGRPFSAVIIDLTVPGGIGGREIIFRLRQMDPGVRAIVSSGYADDPVIAEFTKYGFRGVIGKPYRMEELSEALRKATLPA